MTSGRRDADRLAAATWYLAAALTFWSFGFASLQDGDLWWHIAGGRWIVEHGTVRAPDPFSYTAAGRYWLNDSWLSDVLLYLWAHAFGLESLAYWKWLVIVAAWLILFRLLVRLSGDRLASWLAATFGLAVAAPFLDVRPQLYALLGWALVLDATIARSQPRPWLPIVFLIWANLHASFVLGLLTLPVVLFPSVRRRGHRVRVPILAAVCFGVTLINPHGGAAVMRALEHAFDPPGRTPPSDLRALACGSGPCRVSAPSSEAFRSRPESLQARTRRPPLSPLARRGRHSLRPR